MEKAMGGRLKNYRSRRDLFDEVFGRGDVVNPYYQQILELYGQYTAQDIAQLDKNVRNFVVGGESTSSDENGMFPVDLLPRIIPAEEWERLERGVIQRNMALNAFIHDIYHQKHIFRDKIIPAERVLTSRHYCSAMQGVKPAAGIYNHLSGTDVIRHSDGRYYVLKDNVRNPSGIRDVLANRQALQKTLQKAGAFPEKVKALDEYTDKLLSLLQSLAPQGKEDPSCAVLSEGLEDAALLEHDFLAKSMGIPLLRGKDLFVKDKKVYRHSPEGPEQIDVLYRHHEDDFSDPLTFDPDSIYGVPGIMEAYRQGNVTLINAPGAGVADDKAVYAYVPAMIRYYLNEEPLLHNIHTYHCSDDNDYHYIMRNMDKLVIKQVDQYEECNILIGNKATEEELSTLKTQIAENRSNYIAQSIMQLSTHPTYVADKQQFEPRHIDLRIYTLLGKDMQYVPKGGLTRVAIEDGEMIVSSGQGRWAKDTWVLAETRIPQKAEGPEFRDREPMEKQTLNYTFEQRKDIKSR